MPRIRKKTSNRVKVNDRAKVKKKVHDSKKKKAKLAKKNPQWKSKTPKDPGIPNDFPYKDQILAEVAEQRRVAAEEKQRKKDEKQKALTRTRAIARGETVADDEEEQDDDPMQGGSGAEDEEDDADSPKGKKDLNVGAESIASLSAKTINMKLKPRPRPTVEAVEEEEEEVPVLVNRDLPNLQSVVDKSDVVLEVVDGRDPLAFRSKNLEELAKEKGKKVLLVVNKIDTCPREAVSAWLGHLRTEQLSFLFRSATAFLPEGSIAAPQPQTTKGKGKTKALVNDAVGADSILSCLAQWAKEKSGDEPLTVAVVGLANVGKSSLINSLHRRAALPIYTLASSSRGPTTTELPQEVILEVEGQKITFVDTPGFSFIPGEDIDESTLSQHRARDILLRSKGRIDRLKDSSPPISHIVARANAEDLMLLYNLPAFAKGDPTAFLSGVARAHQLVKKKGELDLTGAARIVLRDWTTGRFAHYTTPPIPATSVGPSSSDPAFETDSQLTPFYAKDESILAALPTRKELRKKGGLVKLSPGTIDERKTTTEEGWSALEVGEHEEDDDDDGAENGVEGLDVDGEEEADKEEGEEEGEEGSDEEQEEDSEDEETDSIMDEEDDEDVTPVPVSKKQKRKRGLGKAVPVRPAKKVSFGPVSSAKRGGELIKATPQQKPSKPVQARAVVRSKKPENNLKKQVVPDASTAKVVPKSSLKASPRSVKAESKGKVANVKAKTKASLPVANGKKGGSEGEAYDFGKFF